MVNKIQDKFGMKFQYQAVANIQKRIDEDLFGEPAEDAQIMKELILGLKERIPDFLGEFYKINRLTKLKQLSLPVLV